MKISEGDNLIGTSPLPQAKLSSFRRVQLSLGVWGVLMVVGGWLHNNYSSAWGAFSLLLIWFGLSVVGLLVFYLLERAALFSGMLFLWAGLILLGLFIIWFILYPLQAVPSDFNSAIWPALIALGYLITGYYMDKRLWWLAGWEILVATFMFFAFGLDLLDDASWIYMNKGLAFGIPTAIPLFIAALPIWKQS